MFHFWSQHFSCTCWNTELLKFLLQLTVCGSPSSTMFSSKKSCKSEQICEMHFGNGGLTQISLPVSHTNFCEQLVAPCHVNQWFYICGTRKEDIKFVQMHFGNGGLTQVVWSSWWHQLPGGGGGQPGEGSASWMSFPTTKPVYHGVSWAMHPTSSDNTELSLRPTLWYTTHPSRCTRSRTTIHSHTFWNIHLK